MLFNTLKMLLAIITKEVEHNGSILCNFTANRGLAIKNTHRVAVKSVKTGCAKLVLFTAEISFKCLVIFCSAGGTTDRVYLQRKIFNTKSAKNAFSKGNNLCVCGRLGGAKAFNSKLMKFTKAACLSLFIAVATANVTNLKGQCAVHKTVFNSASNNTCSKFGTKGNASSALVVKGIHFLLNNVGSISNASFKYLGVFENRHPYFFKAVKSCGIKHKLFYKLPFIAVLRQKVASTLYSTVNFCH